MLRRGVMVACLVAGGPAWAAVVSGTAPPYPAAGARIVSVTGFTPPGVEAPSGPLVLVYDDGTVVRIGNERGDFSEGGAPAGQDGADAVLTQVGFDQVRLAADDRTVGWLAGYMMCAQSYACDVELVLFHSGRRTVVIRPAAGVALGWAFEDGGARVALFSAFPHGDSEGVCGLYDASSGRLVAVYRPGGGRPGWVQDAAGGDGCH